MFPLTVVSTSKMFVDNIPNVETLLWKNVSSVSR